MKWFVILFFSPALLFAEYRVFELRITDTKKKKNNTRIVYSTMDWIQYPQYHHLKNSEVIELMDHWMCWKRADGEKPLCKRPVTTKTLKSESEDEDS